MVFSLALVVDEMMNGKEWCGNVTVCNARCCIGFFSREVPKRVMESAEIAHLPTPTVLCYV